MPPIDRAIAWLALGCAAWVAPLAHAQNYSDIWWNPNESGWGLTLADHETQLFGVWYTYAANGSPVWYVIPGGTFSGGKRFFSGDIYQTTGPPYNVTFNPGQVVVSKLGTASFDFSPPGLPPGTALFTYTIGPLSQTKQIQRQPFGSAVPNWGTDYTDIWWNASESGWGLTLAQHGNNVFGVWFTYDTSGNPLWVVLPGVTFNGNNSFSGTFYTTTGPYYANVPFDPARVVVTRAGTATLAFNGRTGTFTPVVNGFAQTKTITSQPFGNPPPSGGATATAVGVPAGNPASATIGVAGGSLSSADGRIAVTFPAGALASNTVIGIQPITNMAHGKIGAAYRLTPTDQAFLAPVTLRFRYTDEDLEGTAAEALGAAFQTAAGYWQWAGESSVDTAAKTVSVVTTHFSDWSAVQGFQIRPRKKTVALNGSVVLQVAYCFTPDLGEIASLMHDCDDELSFGYLNRVDQWSVNGVPGGGGAIGTVAGFGNLQQATYTAPPAKPTPNPVAVSARVDYRSKGRTLVVSNITIADDSWSGTATSVNLYVTTTVEVAWVLDSIVNNVAVYLPTGTATVSNVVAPGCTAKFDPSSHPLDLADGKLTVDYNATPPTYHGLAVTIWPATLTAISGDCEGVVPSIGGGVWFGSDTGEAAGVVGPDGVTIEGSDAGGLATLHWKFTRGK